MNKTDAELNVTLAKLLGWKFHPEFPDGPDHPAEYTTETPDGKMLCGYSPDYCNDLNAVHEAEALVWAKGLQDKWLDLLVKVVVGPSPDVHWCDYHCFPQVYRATARQRAEALYRTLHSLNPES